EKAYLDGDVADAIGRYERLLSICRAQSGADFAADLCRFRIARCHLQAGNLKQAVELLEAAARSGSPIIRAAANLELGALDCSQGGYLRGRMKGYLCLAALASLERRSSLRRDCGFLIARCLTEKVLSFSAIDASVPWRQRPGQSDPFVGLDALAMRRVLEEGAGDEAALLGPQIEKAHSRPVASRWKVACHRLPLEEFLHRLADETAMDVQWVDVSPEARRRPLTLTCRSAPAQTVFEIACGAVGLIARFTGEKVIIHNPHTVPSMVEQRSLIRVEAISAWRRFYLRAPADPRSAQGHFASALLGECGGDDLSALREYRLIARRYPRDTEVAPWALLRGARLRIELQDHRGARADLKDLLDMYPDFPAIEEAHVSLGHATMRAGRLDEALDLFQKLYYFDLSTRSQARACLGAGRCLFALDRYEDACKWLGRYVSLSRNRVGQEMADAYMLIGRCLARLGNLSEAASAFRHVLSLKPSRSQRVDALLALAKTQTRRSHFGRAIATLDKVDQETLSASQHAVATLAKVRTFRAMGLPERGLGLLRRAGTSVKDPAARIEMAMEAARCHADTGDLAAAGKILAEMLPRDDLGPAARQEASIELARICLAEGKPAQSVAICQNLLTPAPPEDVRRRVLAILAQAYEQQRDHQRAAMALSGLPRRTNAPEKP
ncbi:MAG: tetratricopeptide repeat protein, partial [Planctomycetota bacterium]